VRCITANVNAGRCVNGSDARDSVAIPSGFATSTIDRYLIGAAAWSKSHVNGNTTGGDGAAAARVNGVTAGLGLDEDGGGRVTEALFAGLAYRTARRLAGVRLKGG